MISPSPRRVRTQSQLLVVRADQERGAVRGSGAGGRAGGANPSLGAALHCY